MTEKQRKAVEEITEIKARVFDLANSFAGNDTGNAATYLHQSCNKMIEAIQCLERGNPKEPIPIDAMIESLGGIEMATELSKLCARK